MSGFKHFFRCQRSNLKVLIFILSFVIFAFLKCHNFFNSSRHSGNTCRRYKETYDVEETALSTEQLRERIKCLSKNGTTRIIRRDRFVILQNYIKASKYFECYETITYVTHSDFTYLNNLVPLLMRWQAPISLALYAPGDDFYATLYSIFYLRNCHEKKKLVKDFVAFHVFFDSKSDILPDLRIDVLKAYENFERTLECANFKNILNFPADETFKSRNKLDYPINVARNVARKGATTHFILVSDIELYPNNFIQQFLRMILADVERKFQKARNVFVLPIFEIELNQTIPNTKEELIDLFNDHKIFWFHHKICRSCHLIPKSEYWLNDTSCNRMRVHTTAKRQGEFHHWEPLYVGTNNEPFYDERLAYEGSSEKMPQAYTMCVLDYNFNVLSNAFLVHKNGIKTPSEAVKHYEFGKKIIIDKILPEITFTYGKREGCKMFN